MSTGFVLFHLMEQMVQFDIPLILVLKIFILRLPEMLFYTLPMSLLLGVMLAYSRLASDREIQAFQIFGAAPWRLYRVPVIFAVGVSGFTILCNETFIPPSVFAARQALSLAQHGEPVLKQQTDFYYRYQDNTGNKYIFYAAMATQNTLKTVTVQHFENDRLITLLQAKGAQLEKGQWVFYQGTSLHMDSSSDYKSHFETFTYPFQLGFQQVLHPKEPLEMNLRELGQYISSRVDAGLPAEALNVRWHHKISIPFAGVLFAFVGCFLGIQAQPGKGQSFGLCLGVIFLYYLLMAIGTALGDSGVIFAPLAAWMPHLTVLVLFGLWRLTQAVSEGLKT